MAAFLFRQSTGCFMRNLATLASRAAGVGCLTLLLCFNAEAQDKTKNYKELDQDALMLFKEGKFEESYKIWKYISSDYSRAEFRNLRNDNPIFIAWSAAFHTSIVRDGFAQKQARPLSPNAAVRANAEAAYTNAVDLAKEMMSRSNVPKAAQDKLIKAAAQPLEDALKKKQDEPGKK